MPWGRGQKLVGIRASHVNTEARGSGAGGHVGRGLVRLEMLYSETGTRAIRSQEPVSRCGDSQP